MTHTPITAALTLTFDPATLHWDPSTGLLPAIIQQAYSGEVLMLGYMNQAALEATLSSGHVTFYSRSRQCLWEKGESSGHTLVAQAIFTDCDQDTLLVHAINTGPTCHLGKPSCFGPGNQSQLAFLAQLEALIVERRHQAPPDSYTAQLLNAPLARAAQKVGEEGVEVALAAVAADDAALCNESADLLYHLIVLLQKKGVSLAQVLTILQQRHRTQDNCT